MEKPVIIKESLFLLIVSVICTVFFSLCLIFSTLSCLGKQDLPALILCALLFGCFTLSGLALFICCVRRRLVFYHDRVAYTPFLGRKRSFSYSEIGAVVQKKERFIIYSYDGRKLAGFEDNMSAFYEALFLLCEKHVKIILQSPDYPDETGAALTMPSGTGFPQRIKDWNRRLNLTDKNAYLRSRYHAETIQKQKRIIRALHTALIILSLVSVFLPVREKLGICILILLFHYFVFLFFYPKLTLEKAKNCDSYHIPFPMAAGVISILLSINFILITNMDENRWLFFFTALFFLLLLPCLIMLWLRRIKEHPFMLLNLALALLFLSFYLLPAACYVTSYKPVHDTVTVLYMDVYQGSRTTSYDIFVVWRGREQKMDVSRKLYQSVAPGDTVTVCSRKSFWGMEIWQVHR